MLYRSKYRIESSRLKDWDYSTPWWYYITICTRNFKCWFGHVDKGKIILNNLGNIVQEEWIKTNEIRSNVDIDYYTIMPNHFHGITIIEG
ncbi:MAG TPA: hypothetical protein VIY47_08060, partial [Ignavibacteriaceae bacterium]